LGGAIADLSRNKLTDLPEDLAQCSRLEELVLGHNQLPCIPPCVFSLGALTALVASDNKITALDARGLLQLRALAMLDLSNNDIAAVPPELGLHQGLRRLQLEGNPSKVPRPMDLLKGTAHILQLLRNRIPS
jgi:Leucine-rich repeat (LRR) protein